MPHSQKDQVQKGLDAQAKQDQYLSQQADQRLNVQGLQKSLNQNPLAPPASISPHSSLKGPSPSPVAPAHRPDWRLNQSGAPTVRAPSPQGRLQDQARLSHGLKTSRPQALAESMLRSRLGVPGPLGNSVSRLQSSSLRPQQPSPHLQPAGASFSSHPKSPSQSLPSSGGSLPKPGARPIAPTRDSLASSSKGGAGM